MSIVLSGTTNDILVNNISVATDTEVSSAITAAVNTAGIALKTIATGTATFTATTNNINLTGIGVGIEIGDVIQISGAEDVKNNSEFTVEVITDNNNIIVNQAHANKGTSKNVANRASDAGVTVKLLSKWYNAPLGLGQDWVQVSKNTLNVTYSNNTKREIELHFSVTSAASDRLLFQATYDDILPLNIVLSQYAIASQYHIMSHYATYSKNFKITYNAYTSNVLVYEKR